MKYDIKSLNKYFNVFFKASIVTFLIVPPAIIWWKEYVMRVY
jgi:hypothetical protein